MSIENFIKNLEEVDEFVLDRFDVFGDDISFDLLSPELQNFCLSIDQEEQEGEF